MSIPTDMPRGIETIDPNRFDIYKSEMVNSEKEQMRDQIAMLEAEIDRQQVIIDALIKAIKVIERG